jgi:large conductance mechanosensitive channel
MNLLCIYLGDKTYRNKAVWGQSMKEVLQKKSEQALKFIEKFKAFALKGNVIDMAVGIIIGAAFKDVVSSLVKDILMPPIGLLLGGINFTEYAITLKQAVFAPGGEKIQDAVTLKIGQFMQSIFDFTIIAFALFIVVRALAQAYHVFEKQAKEDAEKQQEAQESQEKLLTDIRDILREKNN